MPAIYTRGGDKGDTALYGGSRVSKDNMRVEAYGTVDEANTLIGQAKAGMGECLFRDAVHTAQQRLFVVGAELASDYTGRARLADLVGPPDIANLEHLIDQTLETTGPPTSFVVPGRDERSAAFHVARSAVRRAERRVLTLAAHEEVRPDLVKYLNRLSDAMYAVARVLEHQHEVAVVEAVVRRNLKELGDQLGLGSLETTRVDAPFTLKEADVMARAVEQAALAMGLPVAFAAVDASGITMLVRRMPGTLLVSLDLAVNKAWTAAALRQPTDQLKEQVLASGELYGLQASNQGRVVVFGGGQPVRAAGQVVGGIGVSGGTVEQDMELVRAAMAMREEQR